MEHMMILAITTFTTTALAVTAVFIGFAAGEIVSYINSGDSSTSEEN